MTPLSVSSSALEDNPQQSSEFAKNWRKVKACKRCNRLKSKCFYEDPSYSSCKRCFLAGVECSPYFDPTDQFKIARPRKKSKIVNIPEFKHLANYINKLQTSTNGIEIANADDTVKASIVTEISGLWNVKLQMSNFISQIDYLVQQKETLLRDTDPSSSKQAKNSSAINNDNNAFGTEPLLPPSIITPQNLPIIPFEKNVLQELVKLNYLTFEVIHEKYQYFRQHLLVYWPAIKVPDSYTVEYLMKHKPLLLLSFIVNCCATLNDHTLYNILSYYLDMNLSHRIFINGNLSVDVIQSYLILSIWNPPPKQWGTFKHQLHLLTALNLNLVVDLGTRCEQILFDNTNDPDNLSFNDNEIVRLYLMIYSSCGSLGLSLPKFKSVIWTSNHHLASTYLYDKFINNARYEDDRTDIFIYYISKLISIGQDVVTKLDSCTDDFYDDPGSLNDLITGYEDRLLKLMLDYQLTDPNASSKENPLVGLTYQQILMSMYDHLIYKSLSSSLIFFINNAFNHPKVESNQYKVYKLSIAVLEKLILVCRKLVETFTKVCDTTLNIPTFFNYRPMNAIISLTKAKILIKLLIFEFSNKPIRPKLENQVLFNDELIKDITDLDFNLKSFFNHFYKKYEGHAKSSTTFLKMFAILKKTKKLIKLVDQILNKKKPRGGNFKSVNSSSPNVILTPNENVGVSKSADQEVIAGFSFQINKDTTNNEISRQENNLSITSSLANNDLLNLLYELGKEKAVENIGPLGLNSEIKRKERAERRRQKMVNSTDSDSIGSKPSPNVGNNIPNNEFSASVSLNVNNNNNNKSQGPVVNNFFRELFSDNLFSDIINDSVFEEYYPDINQIGIKPPNLNSINTIPILRSPPVQTQPVISQSVAMEPTNESNSEYASAVSYMAKDEQNHEDLSYPGSFVPPMDISESANLLLYNKGGFSSLNQFLESPAPDLFQNTQSIDRTLISGGGGSIPLTTNRSFGGSSSNGEEYKGDDFWTNKKINHSYNMNGLTFN